MSFRVVCSWLLLVLALIELVLVISAGLARDWPVMCRASAVGVLCTASAWILRRRR